MADIGVLNLTIKDNSEQTVKGLDQLTDALRRVREVVSSVKISPVANSIKRLATAVNQNLSGNTITKIRMLSNELEKLKGLGNLNIKISGGSSIKSVADSIHEAGMAMGGINTGFEEIGARAYSAREELDGFNHSMQETVQLMQNTNWSGGLNQFREMFAEMSRMRMMFSLPAGEQTGISTEVENGWTSWRDGAIEVEGYVDDIDTSMNRLEGTVDSTAGKLYSSTTESVSSAMEQIKMLAMQYATEIGKLYNQLYDENGATRVGVDIEGILSQIADYEHRIQELADIYRELEGVTEQASTAGSFSQTTEELYEVRDGFDAATQAAQSYNEAIEFARKWNESGANAGGYNGQESAGIAFMNNLIENASEADLLGMRIDALRDKLYEMVTSGKASTEQMLRMISQIRSLQEKYDNLTNAVDETKRSFSETIFGADGLNGAFKRMFPTLSMLLKRFKSMVFMRSIRYIIRQISAGFREGVENVYHYSKAVGTGLAPAMDQAATALQQMKNSIGAAVAPVIQALVPVLQNVVNWFINLINYANQFFALLSGQSTWTRALPEQAEAFEKSTKSAKGASKAMKDLLADWDELNIIQSQSGGGGGSGTGKTAEEYKNMFEEVNRFDESVKDTLRFINDHLGGLPGILKKAGVMILGWKFSKAFSGFLGDLGKIIAGGAIVAVGLELSYGSGFSAGSKGNWGTGDIIGSIGGALATAIGGSLITTGLGLGGGIGFAVGITAGVIATLVGYIKGQEDFMDKMKWGNQELTPEQLKNYIRSMFTFDIEAEIDLLNTNIKNKEQAKTDLETKVNTFTQSLTLAKIKVGINADDAEEALKDAYASANDVIKQIQTYIDDNEKSLTTTFSVAPLKDNNGNDITMDVLKEVGIANTTLKEYFKGLGKELADAMYEGEKDGWTDGEMEAVLALMEHQRNIIARAEEMQGDLTFEMNYRFNLNNLTKENAKEIVEQEKALIEEHKEKFMKDRETAKEGLIQQLAWTKAAIEDYNEKGLDTTELEKAAATYEAMIADYLDPKKAEEAWQEKLSKSMAKMRSDWIAALSKNYGIMDSSEFEENRNILWRSPNQELTNALIDAAYAEDPIGAAQEALETYFSDIENQQPDYIRDIMDMLGLSVWDITDQEIKKKLSDAMRKALGDDYAASVLQKFKIPIDEIEKLFGDGYKYDPFKMEPGENVGKKYGMFTPPTDEEKEAIFEGINEPIQKAKEEFWTEGWDSWGSHTPQPPVEIPAVDEIISSVKPVMPAPDTTVYEKALAAMSVATHKTVNYIISELARIGAANPVDSYNSNYGGGGGSLRPWLMQPRANGGFVKSADLVMANENGKFEMMGRMGNQPVVANNQQIVSGITQGVSQANGDVVSELRTLATLMQRMLNKEFVARAVPNSAWGGHNARSQEAYDKVTG